MPSIENVKIKSSLINFLLTHIMIKKLIDKKEKIITHDDKTPSK